MHVAQVDFRWDDGQNNDQDNDRIIDDIQPLLSIWRTHGQVLGSEFPCVETKAKSETPSSLRFWLMIARPDSLLPAHDSRWAPRFRQRLAAREVQIEVEVLAPDPLSMELCACSERRSLILYTTYSSLESPLRCNTCFGPIPAYEVPPSAQSEVDLHDQIRDWKGDYQSCDALQMHCATGERFGLREMGHFDSSLSRRGRAICRRIEEALGLPTFYYLHRYRGRSLKAERERLCPSCHSEWRLEEREHEKFDFRCEKCRLLSNIALSIGR